MSVVQPEPVPPVADPAPVAVVAVADPVFEVAFNGTQSSGILRLTGAEVDELLGILQAARGELAAKWQPVIA